MRGWRDRLQTAGWFLIGVAALLVSGWIVARALVAGSDASFERLVGWANVLALPVGALGTTLVILDRAWPRRSAGQDVEQALAELRVRIDRQWSHEAVLRAVSHPAPISVRWSSTGRPAAGRPVVMGGAADWRELPLEGDVAEIVDAFRGLPHRQLMVLGGPGGGKTVLAMLLTLGLLRRAAEGEPTPVLLAINEWDPGEHLDDFVARRIVQDYGDALARHGDPDTLARRMIERRLLLPVLDGLDELPESRQYRAVLALDAFAAEERPLVVTCRSTDYERMVVLGQAILTRAAVVELAPVTPEAVIEFLSYPELARPRWQPVFDELCRGGAPHVSSALSSPLFVALARAAYREPSTRPTDLLALPSRRAVADCLFATFVTSTYRATPVPREHIGRRYSPEQAARWLSVLARSAPRDLHWWNLRINPTSCALIACILAAVLAGVAGQVVAGRGIVCAAAAAYLVLMAAAGWLQPLWRGVETVRGPLAAGTAHRGKRFAYGLTCGLLTAWILEQWMWALPTALAAGLVAAGTGPWAPARFVATTPKSSLRFVRAGAALTALQYGVLGAVAVVAVLYWSRSPRDAVIAGLWSLVVFAAGAWLFAGGWTLLQFHIAHQVLAARGQLPFRLWRFLQDAHGRGALRRAGPVYQFRHILLQNHLRRAVPDGAGTDPATVDRLVSLWAGRGEPRADTDPYYVAEVARMFRERGLDDVLTEEWVNELRSRRSGVAAADRELVRLTAELLVARGAADEAIELVRPDKPLLAELLARCGRLAELRALADTGNWAAAERLALLLLREGRAFEAIDILRIWVSAGNSRALELLLHQLVRQGDAEEARDTLEAEIDAGRVNPAGIG
ncbi:hypothetical protein [Paractinoplanes rishiriensis]|uniref:NACHT domain-containing protein n=1 Tax=Paractinoplanes rishiriensis TaxID=1050105 RepID=A0A919JYT1_9ACTN|nr:hypothetical protein [Actinoplanes rishiriensis]GIE95568.1 hypothetical protein Ari01nite_30330 [Actinoplanes rishiriensis]